MPTSIYRCDVCGQLIRCVKDGIVEYLYEQERGVFADGSRMRIVHRYGTGPNPNGCRYMGKLAHSDLDLEYFASPSGLAHLLELSRDRLVPIDAVNIVIMRIYVPDYEAAWQFREIAERERLLDHMIAPGYWRRYHIERVLDWALENCPDQLADMEVETAVESD